MRLRLLPLLSLLAVASSLSAADYPWWRIHAGYSRIQGVKVGSALSGTADPSTTALTDRFYDDGFNRVDASNNLGDGPGGTLGSRTGYFAFQRDNQVNLTAGTLTLNTLNLATSPADQARSTDASAGINVGLRLDLRRAAPKWHWGLGADVDWQSRVHSLREYDEAVQARRLSDSYQLGGVVPQRAPYTGHFTPQPGDQRIGDMPSRAIATVDARVAGTQETRHKLTLGRLGVWCDRKLGERFALSLDGGFAAAAIKADVIRTEILRTIDGVTSPRTAALSGSARPLGWYVGARAHLALSQSLGLAAAFSFADLGTSTDGVVAFDCSQLKVLNLQASWRF
jgi:hypothetical protein